MDGVECLGNIISNSQSTFAKGRQILDEIFIADEVVDKEGNIVVQSWYGKSVATWWPFISPFLFLIVVEGLNVMKNAPVETCFFSGYKINCEETIYGSRLQFINDTLIIGVGLILEHLKTISFSLP